MAQIYSIVYQPSDKKYGSPNGDYIRVPLQQAMLIADHGIEGDAKAGKNPNRQLNLLSLSWLERLKPLGYRTDPGQFGEQIIIKDMDVGELQPGDRLRLGQTATIEITKARTGCERLSAAQGQSNEAFENQVGMLARVITGGEITVGTAVYKV